MDHQVEAGISCGDLVHLLYKLLDLPEGTVSRVHIAVYFGANGEGSLTADQNHAWRMLDWAEKPLDIFSTWWREGRCPMLLLTTMNQLFHLFGKEISANQFGYFVGG